MAYRGIVRRGRSLRMYARARPLGLCMWRVGQRVSMRSVMSYGRLYISPTPPLSFSYLP